MYMPDKHLSTQFDADLDVISNNLMRLGGLVESQVSQAIYALSITFYAFPLDSSDRRLLMPNTIGHSLHRTAFAHRLGAQKGYGRGLGIMKTPAYTGSSFRNLHYSVIHRTVN